MQCYQNKHIFYIYQNANIVQNQITKNDEQTMRDCSIVIIILKGIIFTDSFKPKDVCDGGLTFWQSCFDDTKWF